MDCPICHLCFDSFRGMKIHLKIHKISEVEKVKVILSLQSVSWEEIVKIYQEGVSEFELAKIYNTSLTSALIEAGIRRSHSQTKKMSHYKNKYISTIKARYGVDNISKLEEVKQKKKDTCLTRFGVTHNWQIPEIRERAEANIDYKSRAEATKKGMIEKYGVENCSQIIEVKERQKISHKKFLDNLTLEEKRERTAKARLVGSAWISKLQLRVCEIFLTKGYQFIMNCPLFGFNYDLVFKTERIIIEVNGTYWHGDPRKYKPEDLIWGKLAHKIWEKDQRKLEIARNKGYKTLVLWEDDLSKMTNEEVYYKWRELNEAENCED